MNDASRQWRRRPDVAWVGDETRVIAARTSPADPDGPRILEGAAARVWLRLAEQSTASELAADSGDADIAAQALAALSSAGLIEPG